MATAARTSRRARASSASSWRASLEETRASACLRSTRQRCSSLARHLRSARSRGDTKTPGALGFTLRCGRVAAMRSSREPVDQNDRSPRSRELAVLARDLRAPTVAGRAVGERRAGGCSASGGTATSPSGAPPMPASVSHELSCPTPAQSSPSCTVGPLQVGCTALPGPSPSGP